MKSSQDHFNEIPDSKDSIVDVKLIRGKIV